MLRTTFLAGLILAAANAADAVETVRVDASGGAPRLVVDGKPVRARMFWGAERPGVIRTGPDASEVVFDFSATEEAAGQGTMHFRFGDSPGDVYLDDVRVVDLDASRDVLPPADFEGGPEGFRDGWTLWPPGEANTVATVGVAAGSGSHGSAGLHVQLRRPPDGRWPDFHVYHLPTLSLVKGCRYRVSFWVRSEPSRAITVAFYRPGEPFVFLGGPPGPFAQQIKLAAEAGAGFVSFPVQMPWPRPDEAADWSRPEAQCRAVLEANPGALLVPRIGVGAPRWWLEAHPDDAMTWDTGQPTQPAAVVASPRYRQEAGRRLAALVEHLEREFGPRVAGYHPCAQNTGEWFYHDTWTPRLNGYSEASRQAWRQWLHERYPADEALQAAWLDPRAALAAADVPSPATRRAAPAGALRDPATERPVIDFTEFQQEAMADCVCHLARAVRRATAGRKLVVFFYGYVFEFGAIRNGPGTSGHYALRRVLDSPDIDVLCSPISYFDRGLGQSGPAMTAAESVALAGKMWLVEDDTSTYLSDGTHPGRQDYVDTIDKSNALLVRNTAQCALRNFATWWMDLGASGWFNDRRMWEQMAALDALDEPLLNNPAPFRPEVAAVVDERSMMRVAFDGQVVSRPAVYEARRPLGRMGSPYGQYLADDVAAGRVRARLFVFLSAWCLDADQRRQLLDATEGAVRMWCYAPGFQEPDQVQPEAMRELTGFNLQRVSPEKAWATPTALGKHLGLEEGFGVDGPVEPLFAAVDAAADEVLAVYPDGSAAVALRPLGDGWSLFVGPPGLSSELLRLAARRGGVHLFTQTDCNVSANGPFLVLHASKAGPLEIDTGRDGGAVDLLSGDEIGSGPRVTLPMEFGETRVLKMGRKPME